MQQNETTRARWLRLAICLGIPLAVGGLSALLTQDAMEAFGQLRQPPLSPPSWLFPVVWTVLYALMGWASYRVYTRGAQAESTRIALGTYAAQLAANFLWTLLFFQLAWYGFAFAWLLLLWGLIAVTLRQFARIDRLSGYLLAPYLAWVTFAGYLNLGIALLN